MLKEALTWDAESLRYNQGYLRALIDVNPSDFDVEGF